MADGSDIGESHVLSALMKVHERAIAVETAMDNCVTYQAHGKMLGEFRSEMLGKFDRIEDHMRKAFEDGLEKMALQLATAMPSAARAEAKTVLEEAHAARTLVISNETELQRQIALANRNGLIGMIVGLSGLLAPFILKALGVSL